MHSTMPRTLTSIVVHHASRSSSQSGPIGPEDPGVVDEEVDRPQQSPKVGDCGGQARVVGDVGDGRCRVPAGRFDALDGLGQFVGRAGHQRNGSAGGCEGLGDDSADAPAGAGDERHRTGQPAGVRTERGRRQRSGGLRM